MMMDQPQPPFVQETLTDREMEVAALIADGMTTNQIAFKLRVSWRTVDFYVDNIKMKLGLANRLMICKWWYTVHLTVAQTASFGQ
jgi:non-specific serine/threonine protein kinase